MIIDIPIKIIELEDLSYHILIEAQFNDAVAGNLIIDTGASKTVFDYNFAKPYVKNINEISDNQSSGINAMITETKVGILPCLSFERFEVENFECVLMDLSHVNELYKQVTDIEIAGLIGSDFLVNYEAVINYHQKTLTLNSKA